MHHVKIWYLLTKWNVIHRHNRRVFELIKRAWPNEVKTTGKKLKLKQGRQMRNKDRQWTDAKNREVFEVVKTQMHFDRRKERRIIIAGRRQVLSENLSLYTFGCKPTIITRIYLSFASLLTRQVLFLEIIINTHCDRVFQSLADDEFLKWLKSLISTFWKFSL